MSIRKFLKLDETTVKLNSNLVDSAGLIIIERKDFMVQSQDCLVYQHETLPANECSHLHFAVDLYPTSDFHL